MSRIAVVGLACRFPGAPDARAFWRLLHAGREGLTRLSDEQLRGAGVDEALIADPAYVKVRGTLENIDCFDAPFFRYSASEASLIDPQQRLFLECCWHALEDAAYDPERFRGRIGVYAGAGSNSYLLHNLIPAGVYAPDRRALPLLLASEKDFLASRVAYKMNLRGPALTIQTACSTSLVAVHAACQSLLSGECDLALAGGVTVRVPQDWGYLYEDGGIFSRDGHCRAWDADATGTVDSSGAGVVLLRRYEDAIEAGDAIRAVILGSAINNDGAAKVGYTAPSADGQAEVVAEAHAVARVPPRSIGFVETHGTATPLGDPVEMGALTRAFRAGTGDRTFCGIGSVKSNIGHTDAAAGVASLIKTVLSLEHDWIPATLHVRTPNPRIPWTESPFHVVAHGTPWPRSAEPRRGGVSSFGIGGTNAHLVVEEPPLRPPRAAHVPNGRYVLRISGRTHDAVAALGEAIATELEAGTAPALADVSFTLREGRRRFAVTRAIACRGRDEAIAALRQPPAAASSELAWEGPPDEIRDGRRVPLPTYPFERRSHWIRSGAPGARGAGAAEGASSAPSAPAAPDAPRLWVPEWTRDVAADEIRPLDGERWTVLTAGAEGDAVAAALTAHGARVERVAREVMPGWLERGLSAPGLRVAHAWGLDDVAGEDLLAGVLALAQAAGRGAAGVEAVILTRGAVQVASEPLPRPDLALVHGAAKVAEQEIRGIRMRTVDVAWPHPAVASEEARLALAIVAELSRPYAADVALRGTDRWLRGFRALSPGAGRSARIRDRGVYLVTGGTGGIGLAIAEWLAQQARDVRLVLVSRRGRAALSAPAQARVAGWPATVDVEAVDVGDAAAVAALVGRVRERWGGIHGVVHAAGVAGGGMIAARTTAQVEAVLRPKVAGTRHLAAALGAGSVVPAPLDFYAGTSSVTSLRGGFGQFDYAAANAWLDAWAAAAPREWHAVAIDWAAWTGTGMARTVPRPEPVALPPSRRHPLLHGVLATAEASARFLTRLDPATDWVLDEHRVGGAPVLPGVAYLELGRAAAALLGGGSPSAARGEPGDSKAGLQPSAAGCRFRNVTFFEPLTVGTGRPVEIVTDVRRAGPASEFRIGTYEAAGPGMPPLWRELARGHVEPLGESQSAPPTDLRPVEMPAVCEDVVDSATVKLGPHWQLPLRSWCGGDTAVAELDVPDAIAAELSAFALHPSVTDLLTGFALRYFGQGTYLPIFYATIDLLADSLPRRLVSRATCRAGADARTLSFDVRVATPDGREVLRVEQYTLRRVGDEVIRSILGAAAAQDRGMLAVDEALSAFGEILRYPSLRHVAVCRDDPGAPLAAAGPIRAAADEETRPRIDPSMAPAELLRRAWARGLGVPSVGDDTNFFELGGDSILALQIVAELRAEGVSLSPADFFEAPTIRGQTALLGARAPRQDRHAAESAPGAAEFPLADLEPQELQRIVRRWGAAAAEDRS